MWGYGTKTKFNIEFLKFSFSVVLNFLKREIESNFKQLIVSYSIFRFYCPKSYLTRLKICIPDYLHYPEFACAKSISLCLTFQLQPPRNGKCENGHQMLQSFMQALWNPFCHIAARRQLCGKPLNMFWVNLKCGPARLAQNKALN